jgi:hypothetical protein
MLDLFGMGKKKEGEGEAAPKAEPVPAPEPAEAPAAPRGSHRLWAFLLVLDSVFVVVFAGAVAAKIYQHWRAPSAPARGARRVAKEPAKPAETPSPAASTASAPAPEPAKEAAPEPAKEAPKEAPKAAAKSEPAPASSGMRPPKPSLLSDGPKPRQTPALAGPGAAPKAAPAPTPAPPASGERPRAKPIVFRVRAPSAKSVQLVGAFIVRGGRKEMDKQGDGSWTAEVYLHPGQYRYFFSVDKKKLLDPENPRSERGSSLLTVP